MEESQMYSQQYGMPVNEGGLLSRLQLFWQEYGDMIIRLVILVLIVGAVLYYCNIAGAIGDVSERARRGISEVESRLINLADIATIES